MLPVDNVAPLKQTPQRRLLRVGTH